MNAFTRLFTRRGPLAIAMTALGIVVAAGSLLVIAVPTDDDSMPVVMLAVSALLAIPVVLTLARLGVQLAGVDPEADLIASGLTPDTEQQRLLSRWLQRTRWARNVGGVAGLSWWFFGTSLQGDLLLCGVGGLALGSIAAQLHHVRPMEGVRTASLERRDLHSYRNSGWPRRMIAVAGGAGALVVAGLSVGSRQAAGYGAAAIVAMTLAHLVQRRVASRPRPALSSSLAFADDTARALAIDRGLAQPATYFALVLIAHGALGLEARLGGLATATSIAAWLTALSMWWGNRRLGLDFAIHRAPTVATS